MTWYTSINGPLPLYTGIVTSIPRMVNNIIAYRGSEILSSIRNGKKKLYIIENIKPSKFWLYNKKCYKTSIDPRLLIEKLHELDASVIISDNSDMTLLTLLYAITWFKHTIYLTDRQNLQYGINIKKLKERLCRNAKQISTTSFNDFMFLLPIGVLCGIPNIISLQSDVLQSIPTDIFDAVIESRGKIFNIDSIMVQPLHRVIHHLTIDENSRTERIISLISKNKNADLYNPSVVDSSTYTDLYYSVLGVEDRVTFVKAYLSALINLSNYLSGKEYFDDYDFIDAPLLVDIQTVLENVDIDEVKKGCKKWTMSTTDIRALNRNMNI